MTQEISSAGTLGDLSDRHHAHLWIGKRSILIEKAKNFFKKKQCTSGGCNNCPICRQIDTEQYYAITWIRPEKQFYTTDQVDAILHILSLSLDGDETFFIVIERAEALSPATANRLLKALEEPPHGYRFLLFTESPDALIKTIVSRCVITDFSGTHTGDGHVQRELFKRQLCSFDKIDLESLYRHYEKAGLDEYLTPSFLSDLLVELTDAYKKCLTSSDGVDNSARADIFARRIALVNEMLQRAPMPGSAKIFWRTFLMRLGGIDTARDAY